MKLQEKQKYFFSNNLYKAAFECRWSSTYKDLRESSSIWWKTPSTSYHLAIFHNIGLAKKFIQVFL